MWQTWQPSVEAENEQKEGKFSENRREEMENLSLAFDILTASASLKSVNETKNEGGVKIH